MSLDERSLICSLQKFLQHNCLVVLLIARTIDERHCSLFCFALQRVELSGVMPELGSVACAKGSPLFRIVPKPLPQLRAGSDFFQPKIDLGLFLRQTARPEPVHQNTDAIILMRCFIHPLEF